MNPLLYTDYYKVHHQKMYPENMILLYSNFTPRKSRLKGIDNIVFFGLQFFIIKYLIEDFNQNFFGPKYITQKAKNYWKNKVIEEYKKHIKIDDYSHIEDLWDLGYLPIEIKALEEGTITPIGVPVFTIKNTHPKFAWLTNYLETLISTMMWQPITSATIAYEYRKLLDKYALETTGSTEGVEWQGHDFSMRGMSSIESSITSAMGHLLSFKGTDNIPSIYKLEEYYNTTGLIGDSVPATEHSVMCMGEKDTELNTFKRLLNLYPKGILSVVSDTWDLWKVCTEYLPALKEEILNRNGKLVIRPDSGDPVDILCGVEREELDFKTTDGLLHKMVRNGIKDTVISSHNQNKQKGVIELLWDIFGGEVNEQGYKVLDPHIGAIYGDSITLERAEQICKRLKSKGFASTNVVLGIGSFTYQYNTRDTFGFAMKATYGEVDGVGREIFKDPVTDDGTKKSKKGLLQVSLEDNKIISKDQQTWEEEERGLLKTVFKDGKLIKSTTLEEIRNKLINQ